MNCLEVPFAEKLNEPMPNSTIEDFVSSLVDQVTTISDVDSKGIRGKEISSLRFFWRIEWCDVQILEKVEWNVME